MSKYQKEMNHICELNKKVYSLGSNCMCDLMLEMKKWMEGKKVNSFAPHFKRTEKDFNSTVYKPYFIFEGIDWDKYNKDCALEYKDYRAPLIFPEEEFNDFNNKFGHFEIVEKTKYRWILQWK